MSSSLSTEVERLIEGLKSRVRVPRGFGLWSRKMQILWLRANQKKKVNVRPTAEGAD